MVGVLECWVGGRIGGIWPGWTGVVGGGAGVIANQGGEICTWFCCRSYRERIGLPMDQTRSILNINKSRLKRRNDKTTAFVGDKYRGSIGRSATMDG